MDRLPESADQIRVMPVEVAKRYARDSLQTPQYIAGRQALVPVEGRLSWEFLLVPSGAVIKGLLPAGGVAVVDATTQEKNTRLIQQPMRPAEGVYLRGIVDALFIHQDQLKVTDVSRGEDGPVNRQPFLMANPLVDWSGFEIIEPLPFVRDGVLYWKVVVMPKDAAGIAYQAFVDSRTNRVYTVQSDEEVARFLAQGPGGVPGVPREPPAAGVAGRQGPGPQVAPGLPPSPHASDLARIEQLLGEIRERLNELEVQVDLLKQTR